MRRPIPPVACAALILGIAGAALAAPRPFAPVQGGPKTTAPTVLPWAPDRVLVQWTPAALAVSDLAAASPSDKGVATTGLPAVDAVLAELGVAGIRPAFAPPAGAKAAADPVLDRWYRIDLAGPSDVEALVARLGALSEVQEALPDYRAFPAVVPDDPGYPDNWGHDNRGQLPAFVWAPVYAHTGPGVGTVGFDANADAAWGGTQGYGDSGVVIAIIDSGVDTAHPDLNLVAGYDFGSGDSNPMDNAPGAGHGTACAGVAAAVADNGLGVAGAAGGCAIMPLKIADNTGAMYLTAAVDAINYAVANGADVVSMSFGSGIATYSPMDTAMQNAFNAGVVLVAATGNENANTISYPAINFHVIAVGAASPCGGRKRSSSNPSEVNPGVNTDPNGYTCDGERWWGSNYGYFIAGNARSVDVIAPTILPTTDISGSGGYQSGNYEPFFNGTSCATPYAAGVCALIKSRNPTWDATQVRDQLRATAQDVVNEESGVGWDRYSGYGLVDAAAAVGITGPGAPTAAFSAAPTTGCVPLEVTFTDTSTGDVSSWEWDFGDGATDTAQNPLHVYTAPGSYDVTLIVDGASGADTLTVVACVTVGAPPTAAFSSADSTGVVPYLVSFTDASSDATGWLWDFGDGHTDTQQNPAHAYTVPGTYTVTLIASNACGPDTLVATDMITVLPQAVPVAGFSLSPTVGCAPLEVAFTDESTDAVSWSWDFGDGGTSTAQHPVHVYGDPGTYDVRLITAAPGGADTLTVASAVTAATPVSAAFAYSDTIGAPPLLVTFTDESSGDVTDWLWDFGDGSTDTVPNPTHEYAAEGVYTVTLIVANGCAIDTLVVTEALEVNALSAAGDVVPAGFGLAQNYPNPFNPATTIVYAVERPGRVKLEIFDAAGRRVGVLVDEDRPAGTHSVLWQPRDLASGVYFARLAAAGRSDTRRLVLLK